MNYCKDKRWGNPQHLRRLVQATSCWLKVSPLSRTRTMTAAGWVFMLAALLSLAPAVAHHHSGAPDTYHVSVGHLFVLRCPKADAHANVTWSRGEKHNLTLPTGVEVRDGLLWFLPVQMSHHGSYTCKKRGETESGIKFMVSVSSEECPDPSETEISPLEVSVHLPCKQREIFNLNNTVNIRWMKECQPVEDVSVDKDGFMRGPEVSERDAGTYTCLVDITLDGRNYTTGRSIRLNISNDSLFLPPVVVYPPGGRVVVEVGTRAELKCKAFIGYSEDSETKIAWTVDSTHSDDHKELIVNSGFVREGKSVYLQSNLSISKVPRHFLNVPIQCHVYNPAEQNVVSMLLQEADHSDLHTTVALCLSATLVTLALAAAFLLFKVELVLTYRKLLRQFAKPQAHDGKLYDAYVSYLHADDSSAETASFALHILPDELEKHHGYTLYIRGRDDCPGEAAHDAIAATLRQCHRLIIIVSCEGKFFTDGRKEDELLSMNQSQLCFEQKIGLFDALTRNDPKVILVEIDGPVDYSCLPESLRYIKRKQGSLKWQKPSTRTHKLTRLCSNRNFWKNLRYHMPSVPGGKCHTTV